MFSGVIGFGMNWIGIITYRNFTCVMFFENNECYDVEFVDMEGTYYLSFACRYGCHADMDLPIS